MFGTFLISTVLVTSIIMIVLLAVPEPREDEPAKAAMPYIGIVLMALLIFAAAVGGLAATA